MAMVGRASDEGGGAWGHGLLTFLQNNGDFSKSFVTSVKYSLGLPTFQPVSEPMVGR